jgi:hypothetical protein
MNEMTTLFIDYLQLGGNGAELTEWLRDLAEDAEGELDATPNYFAWLAEKRLDFIKQIDLVEAAQRLKRVHRLEHGEGPRGSTIKPPHSLANSPEYETNHRGAMESRQFSFHVG